MALSEVKRVVSAGADIRDAQSKASSENDTVPSSASGGELSVIFDMISSVETVTVASATFTR
jgi:hypothetical protein